jgi:branched-chain amino acid aminotransferase
MELLTEISVRKVNHSRINETDFHHLEFGKYVSDHMLVCDYINGEWQTPHIMPYANLSLSPSALALHYGQTVFEGMKAFRMRDDRINIFRIERHYNRFVKSLQRMCMTIVPEEIFTDGLLQLIKLDKAWVPSSPASLYIRPFMFASESKFGVKVSDEYRFIVFTGPVPALYTKPIKVKVETEYVRAAKGGTGSAKCGGNYGASFLPTKKAHEEGYNQVLWTDSKENKYIEESGMMNVMFVINDAIVTPPLSDSILDGITRDSLLTIAKTIGYKTEERKVSVQELKEGIKNGSITEVFGAGTAALISPISVVGIDGEDYALPPYNSDSIMFKLKNRLDGIRHGTEDDIYNWNFVVED